MRKSRDVWHVSGVLPTCYISKGNPSIRWDSVGYSVEQEFRAIPTKSEEIGAIMPIRKAPKIGDLESPPISTLEAPEPHGSGAFPCHSRDSGPSHLTPDTAGWGRMGHTKWHGSGTACGMRCRATSPTEGGHVGRRAFGSIRKIPSGRFQARYTGPDGQKYPAPSTFARKSDADAWLDPPDHIRPLNRPGMKPNAQTPQPRRRRTRLPRSPRGTRTAAPQYDPQPLH